MYFQRSSCYDRHDSSPTGPNSRGDALDDNEGNLACKDFDITLDQFRGQLMQMSCDMSIIDHCMSSSAAGIWEQAKNVIALQQVSQLIKAAACTIEKARVTVASMDRESMARSCKFDHTESAISNKPTLLESRIAEIATTRIARGHERADRWHADA